jgi:hypothetical protein
MAFREQIVLLCIVDAQPLKIHVKMGPLVPEVNIVIILFSFKMDLKKEDFISS